MSHRGRTPLPDRRSAWRRSILLAACAATVLTTAYPACADRDFEETPWTETDLKLPPFPAQEDLWPFVVSTTSDNRFRIDGRSLTVGSDGVVRYTLVIISPSGARNVSHEGIRCATAERRLYALGRPDNTWSKSRNDQWIRISDNSLNRHHAALYSEYFCPPGAAPRGADEIRQILRSGRVQATRP